MGLTKKTNMMNVHKRNNNVKQTYLFDKHSNNSTKINTQKGGVLFLSMPGKGKRTWWGTLKCENEKIPYTDHEDIFKNITKINFAGLIIPYYNDNIITESVEKLKKFGSIRKYNIVMCVIKRLKQTFIDLNTTNMTLYQYNEAEYRNIFIKLHIKKQYVIMLLYIYVFYTIYNSFDTIVPSNSMQLLQKKLIVRVNELRDKAEKNKDKQLSKREKLTMNYKKISNYFEIIEDEIKFLSNSINSKLIPSISKYNATQLSVTDLTIFLHNLIFTPKISDNILATMNRIKQQLITETATPNKDEINERNRAIANATAGSALVKQNINLDDKNIILIIQNYIISHIINVIIKNAKNLIDTNTTSTTSDVKISLINNIINILYNYAKNTLALDLPLDLSIKDKLNDEESSLQSIGVLIKDSIKKQMNITQNVQYYTTFYTDFMQTRKTTIDLKIKTDSDVKNRFTNARTFLINFILLIQKDINITLSASPLSSPPTNIIDCIHTYDNTIDDSIVRSMYAPINTELINTLTQLTQSFTTLLNGNDITNTQTIGNAFIWLTTIKYAPILPPTDIEKEKQNAIAMFTNFKKDYDTQDIRNIIDSFNKIYGKTNLITKVASILKLSKAKATIIDDNALSKEQVINTERSKLSPAINTKLNGTDTLRTLNFSHINGDFFSDTSLNIFETIAEDVIKKIQAKFDDNLPDLTDASGAAVDAKLKPIIINDQMNYVFGNTNTTYKHILDSVISQTCGMDTSIAKTDAVLKDQAQAYYKSICDSTVKGKSLIKVIIDDNDINNTFKYTLEEFITNGSIVSINDKTKVFSLAEILSLYNSDTIDTFTRLDTLVNSITDVISAIQKANVK